jgi:hypothetical protein
LLSGVTWLRERIEFWIEGKAALLKPSKKVGVKGIPPLGCFPLWGREGVTLLVLYKRKRMTEKQGFNKVKKAKMH